MTNVFNFIQQVRGEIPKITWPSRSETLITTGIVILFVVLASFFFIAVDQTLVILINFVLSLGH